MTTRVEYPCLGCKREVFEQVEIAAKGKPTSLPWGECCLIVADEGGRKLDCEEELRV